MEISQGEFERMGSNLVQLNSNGMRRIENRRRMDVVTPFPKLMLSVFFSFIFSFWGFYFSFSLSLACFFVLFFF